MLGDLILIMLVALIVIILISMSVRIVPEYKRLVVFRVGRSI